jgi:hypothetical protein
VAELTRVDLDHVFERLRSGLVPERGLEAFAVGVDRPLGELRRQFQLARQGEGLTKFLRGGYGCGKTFMARLATIEAQKAGFSTSFVVVSDNDLHFHRFDDVYRKVVSELATASCPRGALGDVLDRWIGRIEDELISGGADEDADDFDGRVRERLGERLESLTRGAAPEDFVRVIRTIFDLKQRGDFGNAGALLSWLSGSKNVAASAKKIAGIKGEIGGRAAMDYLRGVLAIVREAGYSGLLIVIDEAETILRMRSDVRGKSLNGIRQITDMASDYPGLVWLFTGTPEFFDGPRGVKSLPPLHDRLRFNTDGGFVSVKQPQLELRPFRKERLRAVALRLRELHPSPHRERVDSRVSEEFVSLLVDQVTEGFGGDVGIVPRQFLREFVGRMDLVDEYEEYDPMTAAGFVARGSDLTPEERVAAGLGGGEPDDADDELVPATDVW